MCTVMLGHLVLTGFRALSLHKNEMVLTVQLSFLNQHYWNIIYMKCVYIKYL